VSFQPTLADIRNQVMLKLRLDPEDTTIATYWIQQAYADVAQQTGFLQDTTTAYGLGTGDNSFDLPCAVAWIRHITMVYPDGTRSRPAQQVRSEEILVKRSIDTSSASLQDGVLYALTGQFSAIFWPLAVNGQQVEILHSELPDELADGDAPLIAEPYGSKLLEYGALVEGAKFKKDPLMTDFEFSYRMWVDRYVAWLNRRRGGSSTAFEVWPGADTIDRLERESEAWHV